MAKVELFNPVARAAPARRRRLPGAARRGATSRRSRRAVEICREGDIVAMFPEGTRAAKGLRKKFEHRPRTGSARIALDGRRAARPGSDQGHRPARAPREAEGRLRRADPGRRPRRPPAARRPTRSATERLMERDRRSSHARSLVSVAQAAARDRRRLARPPRLPRAAEVDAQRDRAAVGRARRLRQLPAPPLAGGGAARGARRLGHARRADLPHEAFPAYQAGRVFDAALLEQLDLLPELVAGAGLRRREGSPATRRTTSSPPRSPQEEARGGPTLVATSDRDAFQLVSERTTVLQPVKGVSELARIGPAEVRERYGVEPQQVPDFIALRGDPSDKLPGARGVGPKTAAAILAEYGTLEAALEAGRFSAQREELLPLPANRDDGRLCPSPLPSRPNAQLGGGVLPLRVVGPRQPRRPARGARARG